MTFFLVATKENWRSLQKFVLQHHWKLCAKIPPYESPRQQDVWKLLSEISRTALLYEITHTAQVYQNMYHGTPQLYESKSKNVVV